MSKITVFGDIHIHPHSASTEKMMTTLDCLKWVCQETYDRGIKKAIFLGDLFHDRNKINIFAYHQVYSILKEFHGKIEFYFLIGNHDMFYKSSWKVSSIEPLSEIVNVILTPKTINLDGLDIDFLPYTVDPNKVIKQYFTKKSRLLMGHLAIHQATINLLYDISYNAYEDLIEEDENPVDKSILKGYEKTILGHFHVRQQVKNSNIEYVGSPLQLSFGEAMSDKGFSILDTETLKSEFVENTFSPKYVILPYEEDLNKHDIEGNYLKLYTKNISSISLIDLKTEVSSKYNPKSIEIKNIIDKKEQGEQKALESIEDFIDDQESMIKQYLDVTEDLSLDKEKLSKIGLQFINISQE